MEVSVSSFSTASTSPFSAASCNLVFPCPFLLQVTLSISSLVPRPSLSPQICMQKKVFMERKSLRTRLDIDKAITFFTYVHKPCWFKLVAHVTRTNMSVKRFHLPLPLAATVHIRTEHTQFLHFTFKFPV